MEKSSQHPLGVMLPVVMMEFWVSRIHFVRTWVLLPGLALGMIECEILLELVLGMTGL